MTNLALNLAIDVGPLYGHRTGVGMAVEGMFGALGRRDDVALDPYLVSFRSAPDSGHRKLPLPGIVASHVWARSNRPRADRWIRAADVVHGTNYVAPPSRKPTVISVYDCWFLNHPSAATSLVRRAGITLRRRVGDGAWIHASSEATAAAARHLLDTDRVVAIPLGPPPEIGAGDVRPPARLDHLSGSRFILAIGTEERRKDLPTLVKAFGLVGDATDPVDLVLAGATGNQSHAVDEAIGRLGQRAQRRIHRLGPIDAGTKNWLLRHASALAYPSLDEGFGFPILEAQAAGTPVVASDVGSVAEIAGAGAALVTDRAPDSFAETLSSVIDGGASRLELIAAGHENVNRFSWTRTGEGLTDLYRRALENP